MEVRVIVTVVFACAVCHFTEAQLQTPTPLTTNITRNGCGSTKLCVSSPPNCDPAGNSSCFFSSTQFSNGALTVEISGTTSGYVALGITPTNSLTQLLAQGAVVFVCGNNNSSSFFKTATQNGSVLTPANVSTIIITNIQGSVTSLVQCTFNVTVNSSLLSSSFPTGAVQLPFNVSILNGTTNGTNLGSASVVFNSNGTLDLANPRSNIPAPAPVFQLGITRNGCGSTKLCVRSPSFCDPAGTSNCFFSSVQVKNQSFFFELSGTTTGYVALGLTQQGSTVAFLCGNNTDRFEFFFKTATINGTSLTLANVSTVYNYQGVVLQNQNLIQCIFNTSTSFTNSKSANTSFTVTVVSGTTNGTSFGNPAIVFTSNGPLDLTDPRNNIPATLGITRNSCGSTKLCVSNSSTCDPAGNSSCFFGSVQMKGQNLSFELSGTTTGYVALGLTQQGSTVVFVCGNDTNFKEFFFTTATKIGTSLALANVSTVYNYNGIAAQNQSLIQCIFNTSTSFNSSLRSSDTSFSVTILNGTTSGTTLGDATILFDSRVPLNLSNPTALNNGNSIVSLWTHVMAVLFTALTLRLL